MAEIVLLAAAEAEALSIYTHHEERQPGRGEFFSRELDHVLTLLGEFPRLAPVFAAPFHRLRMSRHPYAVFYEIAGNRVIVHAILSDREADHFVRRRLGQ